MRTVSNVYYKFQYNGDEVLVFFYESNLYAA